MAGPSPPATETELKLVIIADTSDCTELSVDGHFRTYRGTGGGGSRNPIPTAELKRVDELLGKLPDDGGHLPPEGRRLLLQGVAGHDLIVRVFDRANAPSEVWELVRLSRCEITSWQPTFLPQSEISASKFALGGFHCLSADGRQILFSWTDGRLQFWDATTHERLKEIRGIDTMTWTNASRPPQVPEDATQYIPAAKSNRAVFRSVAGVISLWDIANHRMIATLEDNASILKAAFSPDELLLVAALVQNRHCCLRIWRSETGEKVHVLRPFESLETTTVSGLIWLPDGQHILAGIESAPFSFSHGVSVFNAKTGRHCGEFFGCPTRTTGFGLLPDNSKLVVGDELGTVRFWDFEAALKQIHDFEASISPQHAQ